MSHNKSEARTAPTECPTPEATSAMLAKEMNQLSVEEREKVLEDIHGIARVVDEPYDFVKNNLVLLEEELSKATHEDHNKAAYDLAKLQSKEYVSSEKLRIMFLRAESFDAYNAASRMVRFFDEKYKLFGAEKLTKDIVLADLDPDDIAALEKGFYQVLPEKDCAGRKVVCFFPKLRVVRTTQNQLRALYYTLMRYVEDDEEAQQRGLVACVYLVDHPTSTMDAQLIRQKGSLQNALPARLASVHVCYNDPLKLPLISLSMFIMRAHTVMRFRAHYGSDEECRRHLRSFGIPISALPVSPRGEFNLENHRTFMAMQRAIEATKSQRIGPLLPVAQKAKEKEKAARLDEKDNLSPQPIIKEDLLLAAPQSKQPHINEPTGYGGGLMGFSSNFDFLPTLSSFAIPWWNDVVEAPNLTPMVHPQSQLPVASHQSHRTGPTSVSRPPARLGKSPAKPYVIYDPLPNDVLLGRGRPIQDRPGNVRFRDMLDKHLDKYEQDEKGVKAKVAAYIVHIVKEEGGRFLKELNDGGWVEIDEAAARKKVSHAFRARRGVFQATLKNEKSTV